MKVFIFNDTRYDYHFGCLLTLDTLFDCLFERGAQIIATSPSNKKWKLDKNLIRKLHDSDIVIVNGEGTFHHNQNAAFELAEVASYCKKINKSCYLINSVYCENNLQMATKVKDFTKIYVRDTQSKIELEKFKINSSVIPDLIFNIKHDTVKRKKYELLITDAVSHPEIITDSNQKLFDLSAQYKVEYLSLFTHLFPVNKYKLSEHIVFLRYVLITIGYLLLGFIKTIPLSKKQRAYYASNKNSYWKKIAGSKFVLTGRYHAMCSALIARTPFLVLKSNSHKIESLINDIGISQERLIFPEDLNNFNKLDFKPFSIREMELIENYCLRAHKEIGRMFDEILSI